MTLWYLAPMSILTSESPVIRRIMGASKIDPETGCWVWAKAPSRAGKKRNPAAYPGEIVAGGRRMKAHRAMCEAFHGAIPSGYEVDHTCRTTLCVNPYHLEAVTPGENMRRRYELITHCPNDHEYTSENTALRRSGQGYTSRICKTCERDRARRNRTS